VCFFDTADEQWNGDQRGALVVEVKPGSWAELAQLYPGDLILEVDGETVGGVDALKKKLDQIAAVKKKLVMMKVLRGIHTSYLEMEPNWKS
jgi:C-terminal processing protease CtpA/Prc